MKNFPFIRERLLLLCLFSVSLAPIFTASQATADIMDAYLFSNTAELSSGMNAHRARPPGGYWLEDP
ncbi:MAG: hypothetical protein ACR2P1_01485, partial [Pseudomonadales bacterium]